MSESGYLALLHCIRSSAQANWAHWRMSGSRIGLQGRGRISALCGLSGPKPMACFAALNQDLCAYIASFCVEMRYAVKNPFTRALYVTCSRGTHSSKTTYYIYVPCYSIHPTYIYVCSDITHQLQVPTVCGIITPGDTCSDSPGATCTSLLPWFGRRGGCRGTYGAGGRASPNERGVYMPI